MQNIWQCEEHFLRNSAFLALVFDLKIVTIGNCDKCGTSWERNGLGGRLLPKEEVLHTSTNPDTLWVQER